jgi:UDP-N-acetylglucosamine 4,6-dehydratase/5-epimerase
MNWSEEVVLITGGSGSFGKTFVELMLTEYRPQKLIVFSRDELKHHSMRAAGLNHPRLEYFLGDIRDFQRLERALAGVTTVVHAAALKYVPACEYNPFEAIQTNILGAHGLIEAAIRQGVRRVLALSTDKAAQPINLYGATKLCAEKLFVEANGHGGTQKTRFSCSRYGNVLGSDGSVVSLFVEQRDQGKIRVTDKRMTRFWITPEQAVRFVVGCLETMHGGEIFVSRCPSMHVLDVAIALAPGCEVEYTGVRPGEKLHEVLVSEDEARYTLALDNMYLIQPNHPWWRKEDWKGHKTLPDGFRYSSDTNPQWLAGRELIELMATTTNLAGLCTG